MTALAPSAFAATSETQNFHDATFSDHVPNFADCVGLDQPGVVTFVGNVVVHVTTLPDGTSHFATTSTGTVSYIPAMHRCRRSAVALSSGMGTTIPG